MIEGEWNELNASNKSKQQTKTKDRGKFQKQETCIDNGQVTR